MRELEAFARSRENYGMLPDDLVFANRLNRYFFFLRRFQNLSERFGRAAGRIFFHFVMRFDDLVTEIPPKQLGSFAGQPEKHIDADAEIRCENNGQGLRSLFDYSTLLLRMASRADDQRFTVL